METLPTTEIKNIETSTELEAYEVECQEELDHAQKLIVNDPKQRDIATMSLSRSKSINKEVSAIYDKYAKPVREMLSKWKAKCDSPLQKVSQAENLYKQKILAYDREQARLIEEARRKQQEEENKAAEARKAKLREQAVEEEIVGSVEKAQALEAQAAEVKPAVIGTVEVKQSGQRKLWKFRIVNKDLLPREYTLPNETMIGAAVRSSKGQIAIPGVEAYEETIIAAK